MAGLPGSFGTEDPLTAQTLEPNFSHKSVGTCALHVPSTSHRRVGMCVHLHVHAPRLPLRLHPCKAPSYVPQMVPTRHQCKTCACLTLGLHTAVHRPGVCMMTRHTHACHSTSRMTMCAMPVYPSSSFKSHLHSPSLLLLLLSAASPHLRNPASSHSSSSSSSCSLLLTALAQLLPLFLLLPLAQPQPPVLGRPLKHAAVAYPLQLPPPAPAVLCHGPALGSQARAAAAAAEAGKAGWCGPRAAAAADLDEQH